MKVGVTGGAGFIGGWVTDVLRDRGHDVLIFDTMGRKPRPDVDVMLGDVTNEVAVTELAAHVDGVIHLAAVLGTQETIKNPKPAFITNGIGGLNVLEACTQYDVPLVNICVGNWWMNNAYSITKHTFERTLAMFQKEHGIRAANVRCVNAFGPRQGAAPPFSAGKVRKIMPAFICRALSGMPIEVYGDGKQISDCVHVEDVANVLVNALLMTANDKVPPTTVEIGPVDHYTVNDVAAMVAKEASLHTGDLVDVVHLPMRPGEEVGAKVMADTTTLRHVGMVGENLLPLDEGIRRTVNWFADNEGVTWTKPNEFLSQA